ncbi:MAG: serine hydrolase domain-containing protein [Oligoflexales bacterium]
MASNLGQPVTESCISPTPEDPEAKRMGEALKTYYDFYKGNIIGGTTVPDYPRGSAVSIVKGGKVFLICSFGLADRKKNIPVTPDTLFAFGSGSKGFTGLATVKIYDRLKSQGLEPPDKMLVKKYLPDFQLFYPKLTDQLTVADLLTHRTGMIPHNALYYLTTLNKEEIFNRLRFLRTIKDLTPELKPLDPPGGFHNRHDFHYSNINFMIVGKILAKITLRNSWEDVIREEFLKPLGMNDSYFLADRARPEIEERVARGYSWMLKDGALGSYQIDRTNPGLIEVGPAASIMTTPADVTRWLLFLASKGVIDGKRLISPESFELALQDYHRYRDGNKFIGFGWLDFRQKYPSVPGHETVRHIYHWGIVEGYTMQVNYVFDTNPDDGINDSTAIAVFSNEANDRDYIWNMMHNTYRALWLPGQPAPEKFYDDPAERVVNPNTPVDPMGESSNVDTANDQQFWNMTMLCKFSDVKGPNKAPGKGLGGDYYNPAYGLISVTPSGKGYIAKFHNQKWTLNDWMWPITPPYKPDEGSVAFSVPIALEAAVLPAPICFSHDGSEGVPTKVKIVFEPPFLPIVFTRPETFDQFWGQNPALFNSFPGESSPSGSSFGLTDGPLAKTPFPEGSRDGVDLSAIPNEDSEPTVVIPPEQVKKMDPKVISLLPQIGEPTKQNKQKCLAPVGCAPAAAP